MTSSLPAGGAITAQSSCRPKAPGNPAASGAQNSAISASSPPILRLLAASLGSRGIAIELCRTQLPRQLVEHAVDDFRLVLGEERVRDVDVLIDDDAAWHVRTLHQLEHAG